jgi:lysophospholipase L1-like esterase
VGRRAAIAAVAVPAGVVLLLGGEILLAVNGRQLPDQEPFELSGVIGDSSIGEPLEVVWMGDSVTAGVGASGPDAALPRLVAAELDRASRLHVFASSGARVSDALAEQVPLLEALSFAPDVVLIEIGANDVIHLTSLGEFGHDYRLLLDRVVASGAGDVIVLGIPAFGTTPRFLQPLRAIVGWRGERFDERIREIAAAAGATYVNIAGETGGAFGEDPDRFHAADDFHPSDEGYRLWAGAVLRALERLRIS